jgi:hypothetical protein
LRCFIR